MANPMRSGKVHFRPRARVLATLGRELISSDRVALVELVKNSWDADATRVVLRFNAPLTVGQGAIEVLDDGDGMQVEDVLGKWVEPANAHRSRQRTSEKFDRPLLGEKGIGRFAAARLAKHLELITRPRKSRNEIVLGIDWTVFEDDAKYLDQLEIGWLERAPKTFSGSEHGTHLLLTALRSNWNKDDLRRLRADLSRLVFAAGTELAPNFGIELQVPEDLAEFGGPVNPPTELQHPKYQVIGTISAQGLAKLNLSIAGKREAIQVDLQKHLGHAPESGPFAVDIRVWDRDVPSMTVLAERSDSTIKNVRDALDQVAGVSVYRDRFRVLPYGEPGNDWLRLDSRRIQNPTLRLSNNQVVGYVLISKQDNPALKDQTNREGLIQGRAFDDLRRSLVAILAEVETRRFISRPRRTTTHTGLFDEMHIDDVRDAIRTRHPQDRELLDVVTQRGERLKQAVAEVQQTLARYRRLATLGQLIDAVVHEFRQPLATIRNEISLIGQDFALKGPVPSSIQGRLDFVTGQVVRLADVVRRVEPFGGRRRGRPAEVELEAAIGDAFELMRGELEASHIRVDLPKTHTKVSVDPTEIQEVILNLLINSIHWLGQVDPDARRIHVSTTAGDRGEASIVFSDSGPGVPAEYRDRIFEPYFSTKPDGVGLGLAIAGEIVSDYYDGQLALVDSGPLPGATFRITLKKRV